MEDDEFEWDDQKAESNLRKHGVSFEEAREVFGDQFALTGSNIGHSSEEDRERTIGRSTKARVLPVISTTRSGRIRIINARKATVPEVKGYEKEVHRKISGRR